MQGLQHPPSQKAKGAGRPLTLKSYKIANCSASAGEKATFVVRQLNVSPDPVVLPGTLTFQFDINVLTDLSDLQVQLLDFLIFFLLPLPIFIQILIQHKVTDTPKMIFFLEFQDYFIISEKLKHH